MHVDWSGLVADAHAEAQTRSLLTSSLLLIEVQLGTGPKLHNTAQAVSITSTTSSGWIIAVDGENRR